MKRLLACSMCIRVRPLQPTHRMNRRALAAALVAADDDLPRSRMGRETGTASTSGNVTTYRDRMGREVGTAERHREALLKSLPLRNLGKRPAKPALNRGRFQVAARRVLMFQKEVTTRDVIELAHARHIHRGRPIIPRHYQHAREALRRIAVRVGRASRMGRPWLWTLPDGEP
jgi:hypothetical protein